MSKSLVAIWVICCFFQFSGWSQIDTVFINHDSVDEFGDSITVKSAATGFNVYQTDSVNNLIQYEYWRYYLDGWCFGDHYLKESGTLTSRDPDVKSGLVKRYYSDYSKENTELYSDGDLVSIISQVSFSTGLIDTIMPPIYKLTEIDRPENEQISSENRHQIQDLLNGVLSGLVLEKSNLPPSRIILEILIDKYGKIETIEFLRPLPNKVTEAFSGALVNQTIRPYQLNGTSVRTSFQFFMNISWK